MKSGFAVGRHAGNMLFVVAGWSGLLFMLMSAKGSASDGSLCRIDAGPCISAASGMTVVLELAPRPVRAMKTLTFSVTLQGGSRPVDDASVMVDLTMPGMEMGRNRVILKHAAGGRYTGTGIIVRCPSGSRTWKASVIVTRPSGRATADFVFEVP